MSFSFRINIIISSPNYDCFVNIECCSQILVNQTLKYILFFCFSIDFLLKFSVFYLLFFFCCFSLLILYFLCSFLFFFVVCYDLMIIWFFVLLFEWWQFFEWAQLYFYFYTCFYFLLFRIVKFYVLPWTIFLFCCQILWFFIIIIYIFLIHSFVIKPFSLHSLFLVHLYCSSIICSYQLSLIVSYLLSFCTTLHILPPFHLQMYGNLTNTKTLNSPKTFNFT